MEPFRRGGPGRARPGDTATLPSESGTVAPSTGGSGALARALPSGRLSLSASPPGAPALQSSSPLTLTTLGQMSKNKTHNGEHRCPKRGTHRAVGVKTREHYLQLEETGTPPGRGYILNEA